MTMVARKATTPMNTAMMRIRTWTQLTLGAALTCNVTIWCNLIGQFVIRSVLIGQIVTRIVLIGQVVTLRRVFLGILSLRGL